MRLYDKADYDKIIEWCFIRDINPPAQWSLPETGIIVDDVAVGFLITTSNSCGLIDFYISNPTASKKERDIALDGITISLINLAENLGVKKIFCNTQHPAISDRAIKHGFNSLGKFTCFEKGL